MFEFKYIDNIYIEDIKEDDKKFYNYIKNTSDEEICQDLKKVYRKVRLNYVKSIIPETDVNKLIFTKSLLKLPKINEKILDNYKNHSAEDLIILYKDLYPNKAIYNKKYWVDDIWLCDDGQKLLPSYIFTYIVGSNNLLGRGKEVMHGEYKNIMNTLIYKNECDITEENIKRDREAILNFISDINDSYKFIRNIMKDIDIKSEDYLNIIKDNKTNFIRFIGLTFFDRFNNANNYFL